MPSESIKSRLQGKGKANRMKGEENMSSTAKARYLFVRTPARARGKLYTPGAQCEKSEADEANQTQY